MTQILHWIRQALALTMVLFFMAWMWAEGAQWVLRWQAERLLADIRTLEVGQSTWADAERFMRKWPGWKSDTCGPESCRYTVRIERLYPAPIFGYPGQDGPRNWLPRLVDRLGIRPTLLSGTLEVTGGIVSERSFAGILKIPVRHWPRSLLK